MNPEVKAKKVEPVLKNQPKAEDVVILGQAKKSRDYLNNFMAA
ncbi:MAG: hypothetical protein Q7S92_04545 [Candidatus Diapherotrites archaeon]|nr:hypothetical protein [Candidatus Diapherotrites archaeon]